MAKTGFVSKAADPNIAGREEKLPDKAEVKFVTLEHGKDGFTDDELTPYRIVVRPSHTDMLEFIHDAHTKLYKAVNDKDPSDKELQTFLENPPVDDEKFKEALTELDDLKISYIHNMYESEIHKAEDEYHKLEINDPTYDPMTDIDFSNLYFSDTYDLRYLDFSGVNLDNAYFSSDCRTAYASFDEYIENTTIVHTPDLDTVEFKEPQKYEDEEQKETKEKDDEFFDVEDPEITEHLNQRNVKIVEDTEPTETSFADIVPQTVVDQDGHTKATTTCIPTKTGVLEISHPETVENRVYRDNQQHTNYYKIPTYEKGGKDVAVVKVTEQDLKDYANHQHSSTDSITLNQYIQDRYNFPAEAQVIADLSNAKLEKLDLTKCDFSGAKLQNVQFQNCKLADCNFEKTDLREASFYGIKDLNESKGLNQSVRSNTKLGADCTLDLDKKRGFKSVAALYENQSWTRSGANYLSSKISGFAFTDYVTKALTDDFKQQQIKDDTKYAQLQADGLTLLATATTGAVGAFLPQLLSSAIPVVGGLVGGMTSTAASAAITATLGNMAASQSAGDCIRYLSDNGMYIDNQMGHNLAQLGVVYDALKKSGVVDKVVAGGALAYISTKLEDIPLVSKFATIGKVAGVATAGVAVANTATLLTKACLDIKNGVPPEDIAKSNTQRTKQITKLNAAITMAGVVCAGVATVAILANPYTLAAGIGAGLLAAGGAALYYKSDFFEKAAGFFNKVQDYWGKAKSAVGLGKSKELEEAPLGPKIEKAILKDGKYSVVSKENEPVVGKEVAQKDQAATTKALETADAPKKGFFGKLRDNVSGFFGKFGKKKAAIVNPLTEEPKTEKSLKEVTKAKLPETEPKDLANKDISDTWQATFETNKSTAEIDKAPKLEHQEHEIELEAGESFQDALDQEVQQQEEEKKLEKQEPQEQQGLLSQLGGMITSFFGFGDAHAKIQEAEELEEEEEIEEEEEEVVEEQTLEQQEQDIETKWEIEEEEKFEDARESQEEIQAEEEVKLEQGEAFQDALEELRDAVQAPDNTIVTEEQQHQEEIKDEFFDAVETQETVNPIESSIQSNVAAKEEQRFIVEQDVSTTKPLSPPETDLDTQKRDYEQGI